MPSLPSCCKFPQFFSISLNVSFFGSLWHAFDTTYSFAVVSIEPAIFLKDIKVLSNGKRGGAWVVSIDRPWITLHLRQLKKLFNGPRLFKQQKTFLSGYTTLRGASLNQGASAVRQLHVKQNRGSPMYKLWLSRSASVLHSLNRGIALSEFTF